jgi:thioesterase DpgC
MQALRAYDELTAARTRFLRVEELCRLAKLVPEEELAAEAERPLKEKKGLERTQGRFLAEILGNPVAGKHLCHAMLLPREDSKTALAQYEEQGELTFDGARIRRQGKASIITLTNPRYLNAEDETTLPGAETAVDVALLDPQTEVCVLRGDVVRHAKYAGRRLFGAGINLTHLYEGKIRYLWYLIRDLGLVNKFYRGLALSDASPEVQSIEKLWIAAVEGFAIGGHCQILLTMDYTIAAIASSMRSGGTISSQIKRPASLSQSMRRSARIAWRAMRSPTKRGRRKFAAPGMIPSLRAGSVR